VVAANAGVGRFAPLPAVTDLFLFEDEAFHRANGESAAVRQFESVCRSSGHRPGRLHQLHRNRDQQHG